MAGVAMITILTSTNPNSPFAKRLTLTPDGEWQKADYADAYHVRADSYDAQNIGELSELLTMLETMPRNCVVRGECKAEFAGQTVRRLIHADMQKGEPAYFAPASRSWVLCDFDKVEVPADIEGDEARLRHLISTLPAYFHDVTCHWQWSSSAGLAGWAVPKAHIWFWLDRPISDADLKAVAAHEAWPVDKALFNPVQVHYTAAPIFLNTADPLPRRSGLMVGSKNAVTIPQDSIVEAKRPKVVPWQNKSSTGFSGHLNAGQSKFEALLDAIGPDVHEPCRDAIAHWVGYCTFEEFDRLWLRQTIYDRVFTAGLASGRDYFNYAYVDHLIDGALAKFSHKIKTVPTTKETRMALKIAKMNARRFKK